MAINLIGLQRRRQCMRYVYTQYACVMSAGWLAGYSWLARPDGGGRRAVCSLQCASSWCSPSCRGVRAGLNSTAAGEKHDDIYAIYTSNYARAGGKKYTLSVALPFIINYWQHLRWRRHDEQLSKVKNTTAWLQILLCVCVCVCVC